MKKQRVFLCLIISIFLCGMTCASAASTTEIAARKITERYGNWNTTKKTITVPRAYYTVYGHDDYDWDDVDDYDLDEFYDHVPAGMFRECTSLKRIVIPEGVKRIHEKAFLGCTSLEEVVFPSTITAIGMYTFAGCENLKKVEIPETVIDVSWSAFEIWTDIEYVK